MVRGLFYAHRRITQRKTNIFNCFHMMWKNSFGLGYIYSDGISDPAPDIQPRWF